MHNRNPFKIISIKPYRPNMAPSDFKPSESYVFQAEINQLMSLIVNAFYSNKEIFLRELIANASDAMDKYRYEALQKNGSVNDVRSLQIKLAANKDTHVLSLEDNGIGMTKQDLIDNLGTIARSGTKNFMEALKDQKDMSLIGQFGVGFYSAFLVADRVVVTTKHRDDPSAYVWESSAGGSFTITETTFDDVAGGTRIELYLKSDLYEFLEEARIREIVTKHSTFITYPITLLVTREREVEVAAPPAPATPDATDAAADVVVEDVTEDEKPVEKVKESYTEWDQLNKQKPIWMRRPEDISQDEYNSFYKAISSDWEEPLAQKHFTVEGQLDFRGLLYAPRRAPFDLFGREKRNNIKLYVRRVFITENSEELVPEWLGFMKGIVDSDDLPLNVSREMLQQNKVMKVIQKNVVKKCIEMFSDLAKDKPDDFNTFYDNFSRNLKLGVYEDDKNRDKLVKLLRFHSSEDIAKRTSLEDYVTRMKEKQEHIYYITGETLNQVKASPFIEKLTKKGFEVLFMVDAIDEYAMQRLREYDGKKMVCVSKDSTIIDDLSEDEKKVQEETFKDVCAKMKEVLGDKVEKVSLSTRITNTPAILVTSEYGWSANMERIMKAQALSNNNQMMQHMAGKRSLEINPEHKIVIAIKSRIDAEATAPESAAPTRDLINMLYETSLINSGFNMEDPTIFVRRIHRLMELGLNLDDDAVDADATDASEVEITPEMLKAAEAKMEELD